MLLPSIVWLLYFRVVRCAFDSPVLIGSGQLFCSGVLCEGAWRIVQWHVVE